MSANLRPACPFPDGEPDRAAHKVSSGTGTLVSLEQLRRQRADEPPLSATQLDVLDPPDRPVLERLLADGLLSGSQAREILAIASRIRAPLRDIVCTDGYV